MVTLVEAPRGLDMPVGSVALVDADDVRLGLAVGAGSADLFFLLGVADARQEEEVRETAPTAKAQTISINKGDGTNRHVQTRGASTSVTIVRIQREQQLTEGKADAAPPQALLCPIRL